MSWTAKLGQYALVLFIILAINFFLPRAMPGNPLRFLAGEDVGFLPAETIQEILAKNGLDKPLPQQFLIYLGNLLRGDLGYSYQSKRPVLEVLLERLPWTLLLTGTSLILSTLIGIVFGTLAAWWRGGRFDAASLTSFILLDSTPSFWLGMILIAVFAVNLKLLPIFGAQTPWVTLTGWAYVWDVLKHLILPVATLTLTTISGTFMIMRYSMLQTLGEDYITTARSKGQREWLVLYRHVMRNALLPVATVFMLNLGFVVSGATVVETVFSYPGLGRLLFEAVLNRDYPLLQGAFLLITLSVLAANVIADLLYPLLDPRVRSSR
jgi:peptide/nickel transport system permease protein